MNAVTADAMERARKNHEYNTVCHVKTQRRLQPPMISNRSALPTFIAQPNIPTLCP